MPDYFQILNEKNIVIIDDFITEQQLKNIVFELQFTHWTRSSVVKYNGEENSPTFYNHMRKSESSTQTLFAEDLNKEVVAIERKLASLLQTNSNKFEEWQATRYIKDDKFDYHVDCGNWGNSLTGERRRTILLYIDAPLKGGETKFRALNLIVQPVKGRLVIWNNLLPNGKCNFAMIHSSLPILEGTKTVLVTWERERNLK
jgi:prolyl 4-hydroxylase